MKILLLSLLLLKTCSAFNLRHLRFFLKSLKAVIKIFKCIFFLHFQMYINSLNGEYKMLSYICFYGLFIPTKINKQTKQNKTIVKFMKVFNLPIGRSNSKSCQFNAAHASFKLIMLFLALYRVILQKCQKY